MDKSGQRDRGSALLRARVRYAGALYSHGGDNTSLHLLGILAGVQVPHLFAGRPAFSTSGAKSFSFLYYESPKAGAQFDGHVPLEDALEAKWTHIGLQGYLYLERG